MAAHHARGLRRMPFRPKEIALGSACAIVVYRLCLCYTKCVLYSVFCILYSVCNHFYIVEPYSTGMREPVRGWTTNSEFRFSDLKSEKSTRKLVEIQIAR